MPDDMAELRDALDHIMRTARASRTQTKRLRWIALRAQCALEGGETWREEPLPRAEAGICQADAKRLISHLRNGRWDLRSPQEVADMLADHIKQMMGGGHGD